MRDGEGVTALAERPAPGEVIPDLPAGHASLRHRLGMFGYFKKCLTLYIDGRGRAGIAEFWSFVAVQILLTIPFIGLLIAGSVTRPDGGADILSAIGAIGIFAVIVGLAIPGITVSVRRLHDLGLSGWLYLLTFIFGSLFTIVIGVIPSSNRTNKHGPSPKAQIDEAFA